MHASALAGSGEATGCGYTIPLQGEAWDQAPRSPEATRRSATAGSQGVQTPPDQAMPGDPQPRVHRAAGGPALPWAGQHLAPPSLQLVPIKWV